MTSVVRYVTNTTTAANVNTEVDSTGGDYQLVAFDITTTAAIPTDELTKILTWTGSGKIKSIASILLKKQGTQGIFGEVSEIHVTIDPTGKIIRVKDTEGAQIPPNTTICLLLVIGNY